MLTPIAIRRLRAIPIAKGEGVSAKHKLTMLSELASLGVRVTNPEWLDEASEASFEAYGSVIETLSALRGGDVDYVPLFVGFPDDVPDDDAYFAKRLLGYIGNIGGLFRDGIELENGVVVPEWLFDVEQFGADPITQFQTPGQHAAAKEAMSGREADGHVEWIDVQLIWQDDLNDRLLDWLRDALYARSSIKTGLVFDVRRVLAMSGAGDIDFDRIIMKETQALVVQLLWKDGHEERAAALAKTPTDVLRLFAALTDTDRSLGSPIKFPKLSRRQRRLVLSVLERSPALEEDLARYRGLWLEIGRYIHPGEYARAFPRANRAFDQLRNGRIRTFASHTEELMRGERVGEVLAHLAKRPGVLGRKVHELLRRFPDGTNTILDAFATVARNMTVKNLLVLEAYFATINDAEYRTVINKRGSIKVLPNNAKGALTSERLQLVLTLVRAALTEILATRESWAGKTVWVDPRLAQYTVPLQQRAASDGLITFGRGSRIPIDLDKVLRLFVYWHEDERTTDLDLSVIEFDESFDYIGHVSYTNLADQGIVHSGDLQSSEEGAAEFLDITLSALDGEVAYLATQVHRYAGESFAQMQCHSGWMIRTNVDARYESFDIATVANKFDLNGSAGYCVPLIVDLRAGEVILTDLYMGRRAFYNTVEGTHGDVSLAAREIERFVDTRPTLDTLAELHASSRGARRVDSASVADITFGFAGSTYDITNIERILAELL